MIPQCKIYVECQLSNPVKPTNFTIFDGAQMAVSRKQIGVISYEDVKAALDSYEELLAAWAAVHPSTSKGEQPNERDHEAG
jgi:hypothetical protein